MGYTCIGKTNPITIIQAEQKLRLFVSVDDKQFTILEPFNVKGVISSANFMLRMLKFKTHSYPIHLRLLKTLSTSSRSKDFENNLNDIYAHFLNNSFPQSSFVVLCLNLYTKGVILFPRNFVRGGETLFTPVYDNLSTPVTSRTVPELAALQERVRKHARTKAENNLNLVARWAVRVVATVGPYTSTLVIDENLARTFAEYAPDEVKKYWVFREAIYALNRSSGADALIGDLNKILRPQLQVDEALAIADPDSATRQVVSRSDPAFAWSVLHDKSLEHWRQLLADWLQSFKARKSLAPNISLGNHLLDFLVANKNITRDPICFLRADYEISKTFCLYIKEKNNDAATVKAHEFFEFALDRLCSIDDEGSVYRLRGFINPIPDDEVPASRFNYSGQTHRLPMPTAWVKMMREIITNDDFRWPKERFGRTDMLRVVDATTNMVSYVWSPVRAYLILLKTELPIRTYQGRMTDSGEGDAELIDNNTRLWVDNWLPTARHCVDKGIIRRIWDSERSGYFNGIHIGTNKTQDRVGEIDHGYLIPWENEKVIKLVLDLRDWQVRYNPLTAPTPYSELPDSKDASADVVAATPDRYYLFRDATSNARGVPVSDSRIRGFWLALCAELENELERRNIRNQDGSKIAIIDAWREDRTAIVPASSIFDLHGLRVTGLTAFAKAGVPIDILSKLVAGHASIVMTLYYTRFDVGYVSDTLNDAQVRLDDSAQTEMASFIRTLPVKDVAFRTAYNSLDGIETAKRTQPAIWQWMDHGICPNGRTRCHEGGEAVIDQKDRKAFGPVRGGAGNCALCRFFLTGQQFLRGLSSKVNEFIFEGSELSKAWRRNTLIEQKLRAERIAAEDAGEIPRRELDAELARATSAAEDAAAELNVCADTMHAYHNLIQQAVIIARRDVKTGSICDGPALIVNTPEGSEIGIKYIEVPEFELVDEICRTARFYHSINWTTPNLRRKEIFNRMLMQNGIEPVYMTLPDDVSKLALDAATDLLRMRSSRESVTRLMNGEARLKELGLYDETVSLIERQLGRPPQRAVMLEEIRDKPFELGDVPALSTPK